MSPSTGMTAMYMGTGIDDNEMHQFDFLSIPFEHPSTIHPQDTTYGYHSVADESVGPLDDEGLGHLSANWPHTRPNWGFADSKTPRAFGSYLTLAKSEQELHNYEKQGGGAVEQPVSMWPSHLDYAVRDEFEDPNDDSAFWAPSLSGPLPSLPSLPPSRAQAEAGAGPRTGARASDFSWLPGLADGHHEIQAGAAPSTSFPPPGQSLHHSYHAHRHHSSASAFPTSFSLPMMHSQAHHDHPRGRDHAEKLAVYREPTQPLSVPQHQTTVATTSAGAYLAPGASPAAWSFHQNQHQNQHQHHTSPSDAALLRQALGQKDSNALFLTSFQFPARAPAADQSANGANGPNGPSGPKLQDRDSTTGTATPAKTFKPMQMVFRERYRRASASSTGTSSSGGDSVSQSPYCYAGSGAPAYLPFARPSLSSLSSLPSLPSSSTLSTLSPPASAAGTASLTHDEQAFRRQQGISLNYRGDIHNPHNRGDHVQAHVNTSLFLMGLPPNTSVGDLLRAVAMLGPTGRVFAASVNPPDPTRRLPLAAAKISYFTRAQAEQLKALVDAQQLVMYDENKATPHIVRCSWNRDKKAPRRCVQASECRVLRIRGPRSVVNFASLTAYFEEKFRYELQDVRVVAPGSGRGDYETANENEHDSGGSSGGGGDEQTMEWRFASFQSQAIAAKMALNQERKMVRVEYGRDPCEWGEC